MRAALTLLLVLAFAAPASAAGKPASVKLVTCDTEAEVATFEGAMRAYGRAAKLQMKFSLLVRDGEEWERVSAPNFDTWLTAAPGKRAYLYTKTVQGLLPGASYRVKVRFRWRDAAGEVIAGTVRRSRSCHVPDPRPNLVPVRIRQVGDGYEVVVRNEGRADAEPFAVGLEVDGAPLADHEAPGLAAGDKRTVTFTAPPCTPGSSLVATVDGEALVDEADEADNILTVPCAAPKRPAP